MEVQDVERTVRSQLEKVVSPKSEPTGWIMKIVGYEVVKGNEAWRFVIMLLVILVTMAAGRIVQFLLTSYASRRERKRGEGAWALLVKSLVKPAYVAVFAVGLYVAKIPLYFDEQFGIRPSVGETWDIIVRTVVAIAVGYALYRLVDVVEYYLNRVVGKTETTLDDMLVPVVRKALRMTITIVAILLISENLLGGEKVKSLFLSAGIGGIAVALAAKDTIANFFGSITIFTDRPFHMGDMVKIGDHSGPVEEVGLRSTRVRTLNGHLVTIPNSILANTAVENIGKRPFIRRTSNITITYDSGHTKAEKAVAIIKEILAGVPEANVDSSKPPRVYFNEFNDCSLNVYMSYWVKPPDYWLAQEVHERVNLEMMKRFEEAGIEFAFPSQTLYVKKD